MGETLVIQSHRTPLSYIWIESCIESVRNWCLINKFEYRFIGDEIFDFILDEILEKPYIHRVIATNLARFFFLRNALGEGYSRVIWLDADFLIFHPSLFEIGETPYAVGREIWVQYGNQNSNKSGKKQNEKAYEKNKLKVFKKVHNAFLMFNKGNSFLDFYLDTAERLIRLNQGQMSPQFVGPKLLTALHNVAVLPVLETTGMLSPLVAKDILRGEGPALDLFIANSPEKMLAANLCCSSFEKNDLSESELITLVEVLLERTVI